MSTNTAIQLRKSGASGNTPTDLHLGEVAINYADGKLYYKNDIGSIDYITNQDTFGTISANGELLLAISPTDVLTINPGHAQSIVGDPSSRTLTFGIDESQITSFVKKSGDTMTGDLNISTANIDANYIIVETTLYSGLATRAATPLPNLIAQFTGNSTTYVQVNAQNINEFGSADYVVTADVGSDTTFFIDMGMQGSQLEQGTLKPLDGYLIVQGNTGQIGGNLIIGTASGTPGQQLRFVSGGYEEDNVYAIFETTQSHFLNNVIVDGTITGPTITNLETIIQNVYDAANSSGGNAYTTFSTSGSSDLIANSKTSQITFVAQTGIAIGLNPENSTISIATNTFGASNLAVDFGAVTDILGSVTFDYGFVS